MPNQCRTLQNGVCPWHIHGALLLVEFWLMATWATQILGAAFFKHKYLTNLMATLEDLVIAMAANLSQALETTIPQQLNISAIQALNDLS
jgi:hypothetical protein